MRYFVEISPNQVSPMFSQDLNMLVRLGNPIAEVIVPSHSHILVCIISKIIHVMSPSFICKDRDLNIKKYYPLMRFTTVFSYYIEY